MEDLLAALAASAPAQAMKNGVWLYPIVETVHILGFVLLVGPAVMFDLRLLGLAPGRGRGLPVRALARHLLPWSVASLLLVLPTGLLLFASGPQALLANRSFQLKLWLMGAAGVNAALFHAGAYRGVAGWDSGVAAPPAARLHALVSLLLWIAVICCGRLVAYT